MWYNLVSTKENQVMDKDQYDLLNWMSNVGLTTVSAVIQADPVEVIEVDYGLPDQ